MESAGRPCALGSILPSATDRIIHATCLEDLEQLQAVAEPELRCMVLELLRDNHLLRGRMEQHELLIADLHQELDEQGRLFSQLPGSQQQQRATLHLACTSPLAELEHAAGRLLAGVDVASELSDELRLGIADLRGRVESECRELEQCLRQGQERCRRLEQSLSDASRLLHRLDEFQHAQEQQGPRLRRALDSTAFVLRQRRATEDEQRSAKRLRSLRYLHELWSREMAGGQREGAGYDKRAALAKAAVDIQESREGLAFHLHECRLQLSRERERIELLKEEAARRDRAIAGKDLALALRCAVYERWRQRHKREAAEREAEQQAAVGAAQDRLLELQRKDLEASEHEAHRRAALAAALEQLADLERLAQSVCARCKAVACQSEPGPGDDSSQEQLLQPAQVPWKETEPDAMQSTALGIVQQQLAELRRELDDMQRARSREATERERRQRAAMDAAQEHLSQLVHLLEDVQHLRFTGQDDISCRGGSTFQPLLWDASQAMVSQRGGQVPAVACFSPVAPWFCAPGSHVPMAAGTCTRVTFRANPVVPGGGTHQRAAAARAAPQASTPSSGQPCVVKPEGRRLPSARSKPTASLATGALAQPQAEPAASAPCSPRRCPRPVAGSARLASRQASQPPPRGRSSSPAAKAMVCAFCKRRLPEPLASVQQAGGLHSPPGPPPPLWWACSGADASALVSAAVASA